MLLETSAWTTLVEHHSHVAAKRVLYVQIRVKDEEM